MTRILFVCMGNICRSPMAEAVARSRFPAAPSGILSRFRSASSRSTGFEFDSAGTHASPMGASPDPRAVMALSARGYPARKRRPRRITPEDFARFDLILAMDRRNLADLQAGCPTDRVDRLHLFLDGVAGLEGQDVPDPYYGNQAGFDTVLDLCEAAIEGLRGRASAVLR